MNNETYKKVQDAVEALQELGFGVRDEDNGQLTSPKTVKEAAGDNELLLWYAKWLEKTHKRVENALKSQHRSTAKRVVADLLEHTELFWVDELTELQEAWPGVVESFY